MNNSTKMRRRGRNYGFDSHKGGGNQSTGKIDHRRMDASVAVRAGGGIGRRLVVMEQASEQSDKQDRDDGNSIDRKLSADARFWLPEPHRIA